MRRLAIPVLLLSVFMTGALRLQGNTSSNASDRREAVVVEAGDLHYGDEYTTVGYPQWASRFKTMMLQLQPDVIIIAGDIYTNMGSDVNTFGNHVDSVKSYVRQLAGRRMYGAPGNHDWACDTYHPGTYVNVPLDSLLPFRSISSSLPSVPFDGMPYVVDIGRSQRWIVFPDQFGGIAEKCSTGYRSPFDPDSVFTLGGGSQGAPLFQNPLTSISSGRFNVSGSPVFEAIKAGIQSWNGDFLFLVSHHGSRSIQGQPNTGDWAWNQTNNPSHAFSNMIEDTRSQGRGTNGNLMGVDVWFSAHQHMYARIFPVKNNTKRAGTTSLDSSIIRIIGPTITGTHVDSSGVAWDSLAGTNSPDTCRTPSAYAGVADSAYVVNHWTSGDKLAKFDSYGGVQLGKVGAKPPGFNIIRTSGLSMQVTVVDSVWNVIDRWGIQK